MPISKDTSLPPELLAWLLGSENGARKDISGRSFFVVLNQADASERREDGRKVLDILKHSYGIQEVLTLLFRNRTKSGVREMSEKKDIVFCTGGGCPAKLGAGVLSRILEKLPRGEKDPNLSVGYDRDNGGMPRRSRRSPRHLRVSGQRRRRYRDERYPTQSPMPLTVACASPELASGKVWIRYPIVRPQDVQVEEQREQEEVHVQPMVTEVPVAAAIEPVVSAPVVEEVAGVVEAPVQVAEPQPEVVETTHPEVIAAAVTEQPQVITESDVAVAQEVAEQAEPVVEPQEETADIEEVVETAEVVVAEPEVVAQPAAPVVAEVAAEVETVAAVEPEVTVEHNHATAPMTRAPAPEYVPGGTASHSDWQRPTFAFEGKGAAGGHTATHHASAAPARPQPVE